MTSPVLEESPYREGVRARIQGLVAPAGEISRGGALFLSMSFGFHDVLSARVEDAFKALGLSHILVVSGYQVSLVFGVVSAVCSALHRMCPLSVVLRHLGGAVGFLIATLYVSIIGFELSATRALIAASCVCAGLILDRSGSFGQRWWVALLMMHIAFPWAAYEVGVLLTFAALAGIGIGARIGKGSAISTWIWVHLSVWTLTSLVLVTATGSFTVIGLLLNLLIPAPWSVLNCTVGIAGLIGELVGIPGGRVILQAVYWVNEGIASFILYVRDETSRGGWPEIDSSLLAGVLLAGVCVALMIRANRAPPDLGRLVRRAA